MRWDHLQFCSQFSDAHSHLWNRIFATCETSSRGPEYQLTRRLLKKMTTESNNSTMKIPKIDFSSSELQPGSENWNRLRAEVVQALQSYGCFEAVYPKVSQEVRESFFSSLKELFSLPNQSKELYRLYPLYESFDIYNATFPASVQSFSDQKWPQGNLRFRDMACFLVDQIRELEHMVMKMVLESFGVEKYYESYFDCSGYHLKMFKYRGTDKITEQGLAPHADVNTFTILFDNLVKGLQIQTKDGMWITLETSPVSFIVMAGVSLLAWTNGRVHAAHHKVMIEGKEERYSSGLFSMLQRGQLVQTPEELVDDEHPLLFKPFDPIEFVKFLRIEDGGTLTLGALKEYCGYNCG